MLTVEPVSKIALICEWPILSGTVSGDMFGTIGDPFLVDRVVFRELIGLLTVLSPHWHFPCTVCHGNGYHYHPYC